MSSTTFSGPILSGSVADGTVSYTCVSQVALFTFNDTGTFSTDIIIPANSSLVDLRIALETGWNSATSDALAIGIQSDTNYFADLSNLQQTGLFAPTTIDATNWLTTGTTDQQVYLEITSVGGGLSTGSARVSFLYLQAYNG